MSFSGSQDASRWQLLYNQTPLCDVPRHFAGIRQSPFMLRYLSTILERCGSGGSTLETGIGTGYGAIWLSLRGVQAAGIDYAPGIVERAVQVNNVLGGSACFRTGDLFFLYSPDAPRYDVIHHQGVLEHFNTRQIRAALAQQVALAEWVVFSVPSVYYPFDPEFGDERLLTVDVWREVLAPFTVEELRYYGDPQHGEQEHVLCVLRGQAVDDALLALMQVVNAPYPSGISAITLVRNEERHIAACLESIRGCADEIIVIDMESEDRTAEIARSFTSLVVPHPRIYPFDGARNLGVMLARYSHVLILDADERVPPGLGQALRHLVMNDRDSFEGLHLPFRHHFAGHWMRCLYPGYTAPRLIKNGTFVFNARLHSGVQVDGRIANFPAENPDLALVHYSFDSMSHYLDKLNRYTDGEATSMHKDGRPYHWQQAVRHFVADFAGYYDRGQAGQDGVHGFVYSFLSAFYRFFQHAKLYEKRFQAGQLQPAEQVVPASVAEILRFALAVAEEKPPLQATEIRVTDSAEASRLVWSGPLYDPSGYGEESRNFVFALDEAGIDLTAQSLPWSHDETLLTTEEERRMQELKARPVAPGFVQVVQNFPQGFQRHPQAETVIGRTMFETDRLPAEWVKACNRMDYVWVPTAFNRETFCRSGVAAEKLVVVPGCFDPAPFLEPYQPTPLTEELRQEGRFLFLSVFDWTRHKGWDALLNAFLQAFEGREDTTLVLKVWSTMGYDGESIRQQAQAFVQAELGHDLLKDGRVHFVTDNLSRADLLSLYKACDAFVLPSRGEGWGRPYMEAMACGLPTIGTNWSGNTAFMTPDNSYLLDYRLEPVPEIGWREIATYRGHRWAEPDGRHLQETLQRVVAERAEAKATGGRARGEVCARFSRAAVAPILAREIARARERAHPQSTVVLRHYISTAPALPATVQEGTVRRQSRKPLATPQTETPPSPITMRWEGAQFVWHSLAYVNREFCLELLTSGQVELALVPSEPTHFLPDEDPRFPALAECAFATLSRPAEIHVRHFFPPRLEAAPEGQLVLIQPWEYGFLPAAWIPAILENVREVWCYSTYVKNVYLASGVPEERLQIVPLGVDTRIFTPEALPYVFTSEPGANVLQKSENARFVFLFVGGTLHRKGIDILLDAYLKAFSAYDDVVLIIKDTGVNTVYRGSNDRDHILTLTGDPTRPAIVYLEDDLPATQLAGLYVSADCLVQPYRGEGFCLPALEAMACGIPAIVPEGGPTDDFVDAEVGWRVRAEHRPFGNGKIGEWECVGATWMFEIDPKELARTMRQAFTDRESTKTRGQAAARRVQANWNWAHAGQAALTRLEALRQHAQKDLSTLPEAPLLNATAMGKSTPATTRRERASGEEKPILDVVDRRSSANHLAPPRCLPTISLCMIVKNEERVLGDCLASVKKHVDEIIVVDTGSTDRTVEIAREYGAKVFFFDWCDDFSAARNVSLSHATCDWLFWMDADDTLPDECGRQLHQLVLMAETKTTGFLMQVHIPPAVGEHGFTIVDHVKLFRNQPQLRFEGRIHEQILEPLYRAGGTIERSNLYVVHSGYDYSPEGQKRKRERDLTILAKDLEDRPNHPFVWFNIGMTAFHLKEFDKAISALEQCLALSKPHESTVRKVYAMLAGAHLEKRDMIGARTRIDQGLTLFPNDPELLFRAGIIYRDLGDLPAAEGKYLELLQSRESGHIDSLDVSMTTYKAHHNLALIYQDMNRLQEAETHWRAALGHSPDFPPSLLGLGELYLKMNRLHDSREVHAHLARVAPEHAETLRLHLAQREA